MILPRVVAAEMGSSGQRLDTLEGRIQLWSKRETDRRISEGEAALPMKIKTSFLVSYCSGMAY